MGFLEEATPLPWREARGLAEHIKANGIEQFLVILKDHSSRFDPDLRWGEEVEYMLVEAEVDSNAGVGGSGVRLLLMADGALKSLALRSKSYVESDPCAGCGWRPEFGNHMVEGVTQPALRKGLDEMGLVEPCMAFRRRELAAVVSPLAHSGWEASALTLTTFPSIGTADSAAPAGPPTPSRSDGLGSRSCLLPDEVITPHARFLTFVANIRTRKGAKCAALIPLATHADGSPVAAPEVDSDHAAWDVLRGEDQCNDVDPIPGSIYMDASAFGAGSCCTQATVLCPSLTDARYLYDQMLVVAPLFLALTAAAPFWRNLVAATDTRAACFAQTWDDRTEAELGVVRGSRAFTSPQVFISDTGVLNDREAELNDVPAAMHDPSLKRLREAGVDALLARHVAHLFVRDPLTIFRERLDLDNAQVGDHWENIQSTNWGTVRFKPPPARASNPGGELGWRVELRTPEAQLTDFENAAIVCVARVLAELIMRERWDLYIPISRVEENLRRSSQVSAVTKVRFLFRPDFLGGASVNGSAVAAEMTLSEILFGKEGRGLFARCEAHVRAEHTRGACTAETVELFGQYVELFRRRAAGTLPTAATFLRQRLAAHPAYKGGAEVPQAFVHEMVSLARRLGSSSGPCDDRQAEKQLLGELRGAVQAA